jgi:hypothetical protein
MDFSKKIREYHFEFKHLTVLFVVLISFQLIITLINKNSVNTLLRETRDWYQKDSAENLANLTTTSLELIIESVSPGNQSTAEEERKIIQSFDIIFSQQKLQHNLEELCILINHQDEIISIDDGKNLFEVLFKDPGEISIINKSNSYVIDMYKELEYSVLRSEQIHSKLDDNKFNIFVPLVIRGEPIGVVYMKNSTDFSFITDQIIATYDETTLIYISLILLGLLAMYFISSYTVKERDDAQKLLFEEHEKNLKKQIDYEKELVFTKRIYHTHHKAEKIMGFIKDDLRSITSENMDETKYRVTKYSNFISRVIYDMKWFDPPLQTIRSDLYKTNLNEVLKFLVDNIFLRISRSSDSFRFDLSLDPEIPIVHINEFVIWEMLEPLIQNSIDHSKVENLLIKIKTSYNKELNYTKLVIEDNGIGIDPDLLELSENKIKKLFLENVSTKDRDLPQGGYGCYIAYQISKRCGWTIDAENLEHNGCKYEIIVPN